MMDRLPPWNLLLESAMLIVIVSLELFVGLLLNQGSGLGRALSRYTIVMGMTFLGALLIPVWPEVFLHPLWFWSIRAAIVVSAATALTHVVRSFGGLLPSCRVIWGRWRDWVMGERAWLSPSAPAALAVGIAVVVFLLWLGAVVT